MYKLLIVDNEEIIVDGLVEFFTEMDGLDLEVFGAHSGMEAIRLLEQTKFDVVLSDIRMPRMSGLELQEEVRKRWPRCKIIFLSGYDEFVYVRQAVQNGASNYILKTEGYEVIAETVEKVLAELEETDRLDHLLSSARKQLQASLPLLQREFMHGLLMGDAGSARVRDEQFGELGIGLTGGEPALLVVGRVDDWRGIFAPYDRNLLIFAIQNIAKEFFAPAVSLYSFSYEPSRVVMFIQSGAGGGQQDEEEKRAHALRFVQQTLADVQRAVRELLKIAVSFSVGHAFVPWNRIPEQFESLKLLLNLGLGAGNESIVLESRSRERAEEELPPELQPQSFAAAVRKLQHHLENGERADFFELLEELMRSGDGPALRPESVRLEISLSLAAIFLSAINRFELHMEISRSVDLSLLSRFEPVLPWKERTAYFGRLAEAVFDARSSRRTDQEESIVTQIELYIAAHLAGDLSLTRLGEVFGHHPYYLSRLYKQITDRVLSDYITEVRLKKAKELLEESDCRIQDVSKEIGILSETYFYRFFKKHLGVTPQEYRDAAKRFK
ncbi:response regulator [Paenibacillus humicola]|uniref:response regulator n=1 Tax=Paenibacillus humicola TaxID=3110540 RepID=UPI00237B3191|nr:response regulator [Paenibacillus humicola]